MTPKDPKGPIVLVSRPIEYILPLSYGYLAAYLQQHGETVHLLFRPASGEYDGLAKQIMDLKPALVGFGNLYPELPDIRKIISILNQSGRDFPIVLGGQMVTPTPEFALEITGAEYGVLNEGEVILQKLVAALKEGQDPTTIRGLVIRQGDKALVTGMGEQIPDLSTLPRFPYDMFPVKDWLEIGRWYSENIPHPHWRYRDRVLNVHGGRGCPFVCNFCYHSVNARYRKVNLVMDEAAESMERFDANFLYFSDDLVVTNTIRAKQLAAGIRSLKRPVEFALSSRFDILQRMGDNLLQELADAGCRAMGLGIESGSTRILELIGKKCTRDEVLNGLARLKDAGILASGSIMVGQDTETPDDVEDSIDLLRKAVRYDPNIQFSFTICTPFPGSDLYEKIFQEGRLKNHRDFYDRYFAPSKWGDWNQVVNFSTMSEEEVVKGLYKVSEVYSEEKRKALGKSVGRLGQLQTRMGRFARRARNRIHTVPSNGNAGWASKTFESVYGSLQVQVERARLRLSGIAAT